jgi:hypothetical protein
MGPTGARHLRTCCNCFCPTRRVLSRSSPGDVERKRPEGGLGLQAHIQRFDFIGRVAERDGLGQGMGAETEGKGLEEAVSEE